jgi:hypothetical protein
LTKGVSKVFEVFLVLEMGRDDGDADSTPAL